MRSSGARGGLRGLRLGPWIVELAMNARTHPRFPRTVTDWMLIATRLDGRKLWDDSDVTNHPEGFGLARLSRWVRSIDRQNPITVDGFLMFARGRVDRFAARLADAGWVVDPIEIEMRRDIIVTLEGGGDSWENAIRDALDVDYLKHNLGAYNADSD